MPGERPQRRTEERAGAGLSWLRLGCLLAVGQLLILGVLVVRSQTEAGASPSVSRLASTVDGTNRLPHIPPVPPTTTTVPPPATTVPPPLPPPSTVPRAPVRAVPPPTTRPPGTAVRGIVPPAVPPANIAPEPNFLQSCSGSQYDDSAGCVSATLAAIAHGRAAEGLPAMTLPANWAQLSPAEQIFVSTNLERTARGLPPLGAMASALDQAAQQGASQGADPSPPGGFPASQWGSNWAGAVGNPLEALYYWMYDDGVGSANIECTATDHAGCWGHRQNALAKLACHVCVMGAGWAPTGYKGDPSLTELLVESSGTPAADFTWQQESAYLT